MKSTTRPEPPSPPPRAPAPAAATGDRPAAAEAGAEPGAEAAATPQTTAERNVAAPTDETPADAGGKTPGKPAGRAVTTLAALRAQTLPPETPPGSEPLLASLLPSPAAGPASKPVREAQSSDQPEASTTPPAATPEQFLNWLDSLKSLAGKSPAAVPAEAAPAATTTAPLPRAANLIDAGTLLAAAPSTDSAQAASTAAVNAAPAFTLPNLTPLAAPTVAPVMAPAGAPIAMDQGDWPQQLGGEIQWRLGVGIQEARIEISPRELGTIDVRLSMDDQGLRVHLNAAHATTRELLQSELPRLRETLQQGGLLVADAQVGRESPGQGQSSGGSRDRGDWPRAGERDADEAASAVSSRQLLRRRGLLDDYA